MLLVCVYMPKGKRGRCVCAMRKRKRKESRREKGERKATHVLPFPSLCNFLHLDPSERRVLLREMGLGAQRERQRQNGEQRGGEGARVSRTRYNAFAGWWEDGIETASE